MQDDGNSDPEQAMERDVDELEERVESLGDDIDEAKGQSGAAALDTPGHEDAADDEDDAANGEDDAA